MNILEYTIKFHEKVYLCTGIWNTNLFSNKFSTCNWVTRTFVLKNPKTQNNIFWREKLFISNHLYSFNLYQTIYIKKSDSSHFYYLLTHQVLKNVSEHYLLCYFTPKHLYQFRIKCYFWYIYMGPAVELRCQIVALISSHGVKWMTLYIFIIFSLALSKNNFIQNKSVDQTS